jgi:hypothetical protein
VSTGDGQVIIGWDPAVTTCDDEIVVRFTG